MTTEPNLYNPIGWAYLQLRGGMRNTVATTIGYTIIISVLIFATVRFNPMRSSQTLSAWTLGMLGLQAQSCSSSAASPSAPRSDSITPAK